MLLADRRRSVGVLGVALCLTWLSAVMSPASADHFDNMYPTANLNDNCAVGNLCQTDGVNYTFYLHSSIAGDFRSGARNAFVSMANNTEMVPDEEVYGDFDPDVDDAYIMGRQLGTVYAGRVSCAVVSSTRVCGAYRIYIDNEALGYGEVPSQRLV